MPLKKKKRIVRKKAAPKKKPAKKAIKRAKKPVKRPVKKAVKKPAKKKAKPSLLKPGEIVIGKVTHYFPKVQAAVIKLKAPLSVGQTIHIKGHTTDLTQLINSMEIDHVPVTDAKKGAEIGLLVSSRVREHDIVIKV